MWPNTHNFLLDMPATTKLVKPGNLHTSPRPPFPCELQRHRCSDAPSRVQNVSKMLSKMHGHLTHRELSAGFIFQDERIPLVNPQRGIFKPRQMRYLLSIKTVIPKPGGRVWYDDQLEAHDQIYDGDDGIDYAFMGSDPNAADNQWLRAAYENQVGVIYCIDTPLSSPLNPPTGWTNASRSPKGQVCRFGLPEMWNLRLPATRYS